MATCDSASTFGDTMLSKKRRWQNTTHNAMQFLVIPRQNSQRRRLRTHTHVVHFLTPSKRKGAIYTERSGGGLFLCKEKVVGGKDSRR